MVSWSRPSPDLVRPEQAPSTKYIIHSLPRRVLSGFCTCEAVRRLTNNFKVDGLTRALTRQLYILCVLCYSLGFIGFLTFS